MEVRRYLQLLLRSLWFLALLALLGGIIGYLASAQATPVYSSTTTLLIAQPANSSDLASDDQNALADSQRISATYAQMIRTAPVLDGVVKDLQLAMDASSLKSKVSVAVRRDTQLIDVSVEDTAPQRAANIANAIATTFASQIQNMQQDRLAPIEQNLRSQIAALQSNIDTAEAKFTDSGLNNADRVILEGQVIQYRTELASLNGRLSELTQTIAQSADNVITIEPATANTVPIRPRTLVNVYSGIVLGLLVATALVVCRDFLADTVKSTEDVERVTKRVLLGSIGKISGANPSASLITISDPRSSISEAYRLLAANSHFAIADNSGRVLLISSGGSGEGKTTTLANLAVVLAQMGKRIIAVDCDLRAPTLHQHFGQENREGLTNSLLDQDNALSRLTPTKVNNLRLLTSGPIPPNPAELCGSPGMAELLGVLAADADIVLVDSPPALTVADATLLAKSCDAILLVVSANTTRVDTLRKTQDQLARSGTRLLGFMLNRVAGQPSANHSFFGAARQALSNSNKTTTER